MVDRFDYQPPQETYTNLDQPVMPELPVDLVGFVYAHWAIIKLSGHSSQVPSIIGHLFSTPEMAEEYNFRAAIAAVNVSRPYLTELEKQAAVSQRLRDRTIVLIASGDRYTDYSGRIFHHEIDDRDNLID